MPWNRTDFVEGGVRGVTVFDGVLIEVEEEVPGKFEKLQDIYHFSDVVITESQEEVTLENDELTSYCTHSRRKNSTAGHLAELWMDFCEAHNLGSPPDSLYGVRASYRRESFDFGPDMNPGTGFVPVALLDKPGKANGAKVAAKAPVKAPAAPRGNRPPAGKVAEEIGDTTPITFSAELVLLAKSIAGEDGATRDLLRRELTKKASLRSQVVAAGGIDAVLALLVEADILAEDDGVYTSTNPDLPF